MPCRKGRCHVCLCSCSRVPIWHRTAASTPRLSPRCAEHLPQLFGNFSLVAVPHAADDVAFEVGGATLKGGAGEYLAHDIVQTLQAVGAQEAYPFQPSLMQALKNLFPTRCALRWFVAYAQDLARLVFLYGQDDIKGLRLNAVPAVACVRPLLYRLPARRSHSSSCSRRIASMQGWKLPYRSRGIRKFKVRP